MSEIKISKESLERFKHDKDVVGARNRVPCPINNQADLHSDAMLMCLFDNAEYVENEFLNDREAVGYVNGWAVVVKFTLGDNKLMLRPIHPLSYGMVETYRKLLPERLTDEQVEPEIEANEWLGEYDIRFYYNEEWVKENIG